MFDTVEAWASAYIASASPREKLAPAAAPDVFAPPGAPTPAAPARPGRGAAFDVVDHAHKSTGQSKLRSEEKRVLLMHTFLHHEIQAAELMAWAILTFRDAPLPFRRGLLGILEDEVRHANLYAAYLEARGVAYGDRPVRDWFWERVPQVATPAGFCAVMGMGFEAANLDHAARFETRFRAALDEDAAALEALVGEEEAGHVRFALHWFQRFVEGEAGSTFERWARLLPPPLSPMVMRGNPVARARRRRAGFDDAFLDALDAYEPCDSRS